MTCICTVCRKNILAPGFDCQRKLCPLEKFDFVGTIDDEAPAPELQVKVNPRMPRETSIDKHQGGPAPSETLKRYEY